MRPLKGTRLVLCALTGFGTEVLRALLAAGIRPRRVITRREPGPYPYYPETDIWSLAEAMGIEVREGESGEVEAAGEKGGLLLVATYHRILPESFLSAFDSAVNLHPSLLPAFQGASPCYWAIRHGASSTGITAHKITERVDQGEIVLQKEIPVEPTDTQGTLRKKLALLSGRVAVEVATTFQSGSPFPEVKPTQAPSRERRFGPEEQVVNWRGEAEEVYNHIRALLPWPGAKLDGTTVTQIYRDEPLSEEFALMDRRLERAEGRLVLILGRRKITFG